MVVQHNLTAMNSNRMLGVTTSQQAKTTEKLSSGYKINRAADDAAGLAISEKMRKQIRGLTQASANAQDGISVVQTAEGALAEVHDMLQRMNDLAVKSANGTQSTSDRESIQAEISQLITEIDRVSETTKFNETYLLKGDRDAVKGYSYGYAVITAGSAQVAQVSMTSGPNGLTAKITFKSDASGAAQNEIANALKNSGINITVKKTISTAAGNADKVTKTTSYSVSLVGAVADKYTITTTGTSGKEFAIKDNTGKIIATITDGMGAEAVFNTTAVAAVAEQAVKMTAPKGTVVMYSSIHSGKDIPMDVGYIHNKGIRITGTKSPSVRSFTESVNCLTKGIIDPSKLVSGVFTPEACTEAFETALRPDTFRCIIEYK